MRPANETFLNASEITSFARNFGSARCSTNSAVDSVRVARREGSRCEPASSGTLAATGPATRCSILVETALKTGNFVCSNSTAIKTVDMFCNARLGIGRFSKRELLLNQLQLDLFF